jgi:hypothetical protein
VADLPLADVAGAAERLVAEIERMQWTSGETTFSVHVTGGIAHSSLLECATVDQLLDAADRDLYAKKWLKKHPGEAHELYEYPGRSSASVLTLPQRGEQRQRASEEES